ncbi:MAG: RNA-directed DNA polymerase [Chloroflexi bacterium]|nr:RNA-directed DNA polymerase [Chloroflexota bacterium]
MEDLSYLSRLSKGQLYRFAKYSDWFYKSYRIPKKSGGERIIYQPSFKLKAIQAWILRNILERLSISSASKGFSIGSSIKDNVKPHVGANAILAIDIENFYPSIPANRVWFVYRTAGYSPQIAAVLTSLTTYNSFLPQGAPSSPRLSNLVCWSLDKRMLAFVGKREITYTRYGDDLSFSASSYQVLSKSFHTIKSIVRNEGFSLNESKTRFMGPAKQRRVTGLILYENQFGIGRKQYRILRSKIHKMCFIPSDEIDSFLLNHIAGWLSYVKDVDTNRYNKLAKYILDLKKKFNSSAVSLLNVEISA